MNIPAQRDDGKGQSQVLFDEQDMAVVGSWKWRVTGNGYVYRNTEVAGRMVRIYLHRAILDLVGASREIEVDHRNGNKLDNRRENIRACTRSQNNAARRKLSGKRSSKYRGVTFAKDKKSKPWQAQIGFKGRNISLGRFATEEEAALAYDKEAVKLYGEFARPNFPGRCESARNVDQK